MAGCVYTGMKTSRSVNGFFKVGMTEDKKPTRRWNAYDLTGLMWVYCPHATRVPLMYLESVARLKAEQIGLQLCGNDCFAYRMDKNKNKIQEGMIMAKVVTEAVCRACEDLHLEYEWLKYL